MLRRIVPVVLLALLTLSATLPVFGQGLLPGEDTTTTLRKIGDILQIALPATAGATTVIKKDWEGAIQFGAIFGATVGTFAGAKQLISKDRPDASNARSFPSGHTAMAFSGSTFMLRRYGKKVGIPLMFTAGFVGFTRVKGQKHFADDVIAGGGIGILYNLAIARKHPQNLFLKPVTFQGGGAGLQVQFDPGTPGAGPRTQSPGPSPELAGKYRFEFEYAAIYTRNLEGRAPSEGGTQLALGRDVRSFSPTSRFKFDWIFNDPHELSVFWAPFESRDFERVSQQEFTFGDTTFAAGENVLSRFRYDELAVRYRYRLINNKRFGLRIGAALSFRETTGSFVQEATDLSSRVTEYELLPLAHVRVRFNFTEKLSFIGEGDGMYWSDDRYSASPHLAVRWQLKPRWDFTFGYRGAWRKIETDEFTNRLIFDYFTLGFGYSF